MATKKIVDFRRDAHNYGDLGDSLNNAVPVAGYIGGYLNIPYMDTRKYEYDIMLWTGAANVDVNFRMSFNGQTGSAQYQSVSAWSTGTSKGEESQTRGELRLTHMYENNSNSCLFIGTLKHEEGREPLLIGDFASGTSQFTCQPRWHNVIDTITSMQFLGSGANSTSATSDTHLIVYEREKEASCENWEYVRTVKWAAGESDTFIQEVDPDNETEYRMEWAEDGDTGHLVLMNGVNNNGSYPYQQIYGASSTSATFTANYVATGGSAIEGIGQQTIHNIQVGGVGRKHAWQRSMAYETLTWWKRLTAYTDAVTPITSIHIEPQGTAGNRQMRIYRLKPNGLNAFVPFPFKLCKRALDFTTDPGDLRSTDCHNESTGLVYISANYKDMSEDTWIRGNNDSTANYDGQRIKAEGTAETANAYANKAEMFTAFNSNGAGNSHDVQAYFYTRVTGFSRPMVALIHEDSKDILHLAWWYTDVVDEITEVTYGQDVDASATGSIRFGNLVSGS